MENITPYDIAIIGGGFTVVGALIGAVVAYWLAKQLDVFKARREACAKFRAAFAPALAMIYLARHHGTHDRPNDHAFIKKSLLEHAAAIEEFCIFVPESKRTVYQEAWENYRKTANMDIYDREGEEWGKAAEEKREVAHGEIIEEKIHNILMFAE